LYFHLILTDDCNLCCSYCRAKAFEKADDIDDKSPPSIEIDPNLPPELDINLDTLYSFLQRDPAPTLTFYGGEPLLRPDLIERIIYEAPVQQFMLQTNGLLLDRLAPAIVNRFSTILVSLDGTEEMTDANRGAGIYRTVMENIKKIRQNGYNQELIARMTVNENSDVADAVHWLSDNPDYSFSSIHWQLDANFNADFSHRRFSEWVQKSYNPGICTLVTDWVDYMENAGSVLRWYPFLDPMEDLLLKRKTRLRCGSGYANYTIVTDGNIAPCPVMTGMSRYYVGHIRDADPTDLAVVSVDGECTECTVFDFCGGRCLYANIMKPWGKAGRHEVCSSVEYLQNCLINILPRVRDLITTGVIQLADFSHEKYNGCEIIP
jgi:putative peptide-modifying radical SAM enzyme